MGTLSGYGTSGKSLLPRLEAFPTRVQLGWIMDYFPVLLCIYELQASGLPDN